MSVEYDAPVKRHEIFHAGNNFEKTNERREEEEEFSALFVVTLRENFDGFKNNSAIR